MNDTEPTSTEFTVGTHDRVNTSGETYVAYVFAHDDQSFGTDSDEAIIKCGTYNEPSSGNVTQINLGFEPQWILWKKSDGGGNWYIFDTMRGLGVTGHGFDCLLMAIIQKQIILELHQNSLNSHRFFCYGIYSSRIEHDLHRNPPSK